MKEAELKLAHELIDQQSSSTFDATAYKDEVSERIEAAVQQNVEGEQITLAEEPEGGAQIIDLMEALRASLEKKGGAPAARKGAAATKAKATRKPARKVQALDAETEPRKRKGAKRAK